ncbi:branched-chain amino acid aminotransferase [Candidatus Poribacteria bacterium]|nr:branched-chain amino acid aminotransferase [Candidatus Poribacteria bacterium]
MAQERMVYINGEIVPESEGKVSFRDQGFVTGDAVFDATRTFGGAIFKLQEHLDRLYDSLKYMRLDPRIPQQQMAELTMQVLAANQPLLGPDDDYWVIQRISRGVPAGAGKYKPTVIIECNPLPFAARARYYRDGLSVVIPSIRRTPPECMSPRVKVHNYINLLLGDQEVKAQNPDAFSILLDINGNISEGFGSNFFIVKNGVVITPKEQYVLAGISRETVIELAQGLDIEVQEADIDLYDVYTADEAFVTSTSFCLCSVSSVNGSPIGNGSVPEPVTDRIQTAYSDLVGIDIVKQYLKRLG